MPLNEEQVEARFNRSQSRLDILVEKARKPKAKTKSIVTVTTPERHLAIKKFCQSKKVRISDFINTLLDEFFPS